MPFAIHSDIIRSYASKNKTLLRSHLLHPHDDITIVFFVSAETENIVSILEDHVLESISSTEWKIGEEESDFSFVTEKYNHFLKNLEEKDVRGVHVLFAVIRKSHLIVSSIGKMCAILRESNEAISIIHEAPNKCYHFESVSSGEIPYNSTIFLTSEHLEELFGEEFYDDIARVSSEKFETTVLSTLSGENIPSIHMVRLTSNNEVTPTKPASRFQKKWQSDIIRNTVSDMMDKVHIGPFFDRIKTIIRHKIRNHQNLFLIGFLTVGVLLFFGLLSILVSSLFQVTSSGKNDTTSQLLEAKNLIEESQKLTSNPAAFSTSITKAEKILYELRDKNVNIKDTQDLLSRVEAMKKEMYDIQTIDLGKKKSIFQINPNDISPLWVFESDKKLTMIGKTSTISSYVPGSPLPKATPYPTSEEGKSFTSTEDGNFFILTKDNRILGSRKNNQIDYVNVMGQEGWEKADLIRSFNDNIYLIDKNLGKIFRHKPGVNGFSQQTEIGGKSFTGMIDIGVDGGFYVIHPQSVERILSGKDYVISSISLNKIPGVYQLSQSENTQVIVTKNLKYIYVLDGKNIWIFEPDSKRFQDVKAWNYIAQLEINTTEEIRSISVPRDGTLYVTTNLGVYDVLFDVVDSHIIIH